LACGEQTRPGWLRRTASLELSVHFREAFVHRQPLHLQLLALADALATQP
jgi:hypothetical protein